jgi:uncharacterized protein (DUF2141 family)
MLVKLCSLALVVAGFVAGGIAHGADVTVTNVSSTDGQIIVSIFEGKENYLTKVHSSKAVRLDSTGSIVLRWSDPVPDRFAVSVIHDRNGNGDLDTGLFRRPLEPHGFSNNIRHTFGPASYEESEITRARFEEGITIEID